MDEIATSLENKFQFDSEAVRSVIRQCIEKGIKHDQLNRVLTNIILHHRPWRGEKV